MLSISKQTALCLTGWALSGCMQSMPTAESLTRPTVEAFTRLSSWTPWKPTPEQAPPQVIADTPPPAPDVAPAVQPSKPEASAPETRGTVPRHRPAAAPRLATSRRAPLPATPTSAIAAPETTPVLPVKISCQTKSQPGERVRMECTPAE